MLTEIVERMKVMPGGRIEFESDELEEGEIVELRIRPAPAPGEIDTTDYLMSTKANRERLLESIQEAKEHPERRIIYNNLDELEKDFPTT